MKSLTFVIFYFKILNGIIFTNIDTTDIFFIYTYIKIVKEFLK